MWRSRLLFLSLIPTEIHNEEFHCTAVCSIDKIATGKIATLLCSKLKTSLKIFKHYKLKPSFQIIKSFSTINDNNAKDRAGVGAWQVN
jgi:hypothetical protein